MCHSTTAGEYGIGLIFIPVGACNKAVIREENVEIKQSLTRQKQTQGGEKRLIPVSNSTRRPSDFSRVKAGFRPYPEGKAYVALHRDKTAVAIGQAQLPVCPVPALLRGTRRVHIIAQCYVVGRSGILGGEREHTRNGVPMIKACLTG